MRLSYTIVMKYIDLIKESDTNFRRLTGVSRKLFHLMLEELQPLQGDFGRPHKLSLADRLALTLSYWYEYRTFLHTGRAFGVSEATAYRIVRTIERDLLKSNKFHLPKRCDQAISAELLIIDATEVAIERPKKNKGATTAASRSNTH